MFGLTVQHHIRYNTNPFGMGMNPRMNFFLGMACATAQPQMYPMMAMPMFIMPFYANPFMNFSSYNSYSVPNFNTYSNPYGYLNNIYNCSTPVLNNTFTYNGVNTGIGSIPSSPVYPPMPQIPNFTLPQPVCSSVSTLAPAPKSEIEPQGTKVKKNDNSYGPAFLKKVKDIAKRLNCNYRDLLGVMNSESGINAKAKNPNGSATGLIQFIESTACSLGTSTAALANMSPIEQLDYVEKYLSRAKSSAGLSSNDKLSGGQLYALIFLPARAGREVLTSSGESYYNANRGLDTNKDGKITRDELDQRIKDKYVSDNSFLA